MTESRVSLDHPILSTEAETPNELLSGIIVNSDQLRIEEPTKQQGDQAPWKKIRTMVRFTTMLRNASPRNYSTRRDSFIDRFTNRRPGDESSYDVHTCIHNEKTNTWASTFSQQTSVNNEDNHNNPRPDQSSSLSFIDRMISGLGVKMGMTSRVMDDSSFFPFDLIPDQDRLRVLGKRPCGLPFIFQPYSLSLLIWLTVLSVAVLYNLWLPIARQAFDEFQNTNQVLFLILDLGSDLVYLMDFFVQLGTTYLECGLVVINRQKLAMRYIKSMDFRMDLISVMPLDLLQLKFGWQPMLRFPRFVKIYRARLWKVKIENRSLFPNVWRVMNSIHVLFLGCHWFACIYFMLSKYEKFSTTWGYRPSNTTFADELGRAYLKCYYWATLALTTIGIEEGPETNLEYAFTCISYLIGLFIFATIVGQVGNIINTRNASRVAYEEILDNVKSYMRMHSVRPELQKRILRWYDYAWYKKRMDGVGDVNALKMLPDKLKSELAVNVNLATLKKVTIFKECRPEFLQDLVLKMRPLIFTPGDFVCRKGEIAREMFIIADGVLEVIGPNDEVISMMSSGDFFGEIGILNRDGANKRTADVRAVGYADLFVLSRSDVLEALHDHPDAEVLIKEFARKRLQANRELQKKRALHSASPPYKLLPMISRSRKLQPQTNLDFDQSSESHAADIRSTTESTRLQNVVSNFTERWNGLVEDFVRSYEEEAHKLATVSQSAES